MNIFKYISLLLVAFGVSQMIGTAQTDDNDDIRTILGQGNTIGGFGAMSYRYAEIGGLNTFFNGGRGGWMLNHNFAMGAAGYSFNTEAQKDLMLGNKRYNLTGAYGGLTIEPILAPSSAIHLCFPILLGGGVAAYKKLDNDFEAYVDREAFFAVEPGVELEFNVLTFFRFGAGVYYKYTTDIHLNYENGDQIVQNRFLEGFAFGATFKFGKF